ncbi:hypothetical protein J7E70_07895 [Variovorax paradoxus]|nr:hypothetical protein [Variovorax paradoxus]MBT2300385.1 hypothetical protein [Variovorax paradoxus]
MSALPAEVAKERWIYNPSWDHYRRGDLVKAQMMDGTWRVMTLTQFYDGTGCL